MGETEIKQTQPQDYITDKDGNKHYMFPPKTFNEWWGRQEDDDDIFCPSMTDDDAWYLIVQYLLPDDWYTDDPVSALQINPEMLDYILYKYSKKYRNELKEKKFLKIILKRKLCKFFINHIL